MREFANVHDRHCCKIHGCKYGCPDCPVEKGINEGIQCEECYEEKQDPRFIRIQELEAENEKLKKDLEEMKRSGPTVSEDFLTEQYHFAERLIFYYHGDVAPEYPQAGNVWVERKTGYLVRLISVDNGVCVLCTPHGTRFLINLDEIHKHVVPMDDEQCRMLLDLENDVIKNGYTLYKPQLKSDYILYGPQPEPLMFSEKL